MLKNILENVLSSGSNGSDDKIKELINNIPSNITKATSTITGDIKQLTHIAT